MVRSLNELLYRASRKKGIRLQKDHRLYLNRAYQSKSIEQEIIKHDYVPHILYKREMGQLRKNTDQKNILFPKINDRLLRER